MVYVKYCMQSLLALPCYFFVEHYVVVVFSMHAFSFPSAGECCILFSANVSCHLMLTCRFRDSSLIQGMLLSSFVIKCYNFYKKMTMFHLYLSGQLQNLQKKHFLLIVDMTKNFVFVLPHEEQVNSCDKLPPTVRHLPMCLLSDLFSTTSCSVLTTLQMEHPSNDPYPHLYKQAHP